MFTPFSSYRFAIVVPSTQKVISLTRVVSDPFTDQVWLAKAHIPDQPSLNQSLLDVSRITVYLLPRRPTEKARGISIDFHGTTWKPFSLDASKEDWALEWLRLNDCILGSSSDSDAAALESYLVPLLGLQIKTVAEAV